MSPKKRGPGSELPFSKDIAVETIKKLKHLDTLKNIGEENDEITVDVSAAARDVSAVYFCWLVTRGIDDGTEVLAMMVSHFIEYIYLGFEGRRPTLESFTNRQLSDFLNLCEFAVPEKLWSAGINPFDGARLFFEFLNEFGYPVKLESKCRAVEQLRKSLMKGPIPENLKEALSEVQ